MFDQWLNTHIAWGPKHKTHTADESPYSSSPLDFDLMKSRTTSALCSKSPRGSTSLNRYLAKQRMFPYNRYHVPENSSMLSSNRMYTFSVHNKDEWIPQCRMSPLVHFKGSELPWPWALSNKLFKSQAQVTEDIDAGDSEHIKGGSFKGPSKTHAVPSWQWNTPPDREDRPLGLKATFQLCHELFWGACLGFGDLHAQGNPHVKMWHDGKYFLHPHYEKQKLLWNLW